MKYIISGVLVFWMSTSLALAQRGGSSGVGGGGDASEIRFVEIANDIRGWIFQGGADSLVLPIGTSVEAYRAQMLSLLAPSAVTLAFTNEDVLVSGSPKTCRGFLDSFGRPNILCNIARFGATDASGQYRLVHHEYAGLTGLEKNVGAASDYQISSQLASFLEPTTVPRLKIKPANQDEGIFDPRFCATGELFTKQDAIRVMGAGNSYQSVGGATVYTRKRSCDPVTGCGAWSKPVAGGTLKGAFGTRYENMMELQVSGQSSTNQTEILRMTFTWNPPAADGSVSSRENVLFLGQFLSPKLFLRKNCAKFVFDSGMTKQSVAYWMF